MRGDKSLGRYLRHFLVDYLAGQRNASRHTIHAYRDALKLLLLHVAKARASDVSNLSLEDLDQRQVLSFLENVERDRGNSIATRNLRLKQPSTSTWMGRRDDALLRFLYNTGARVQEAIDVCADSLRLQEPFHVMLMGKGRKERLCPLWPQTIAVLQRVLRDRKENAGAVRHVFTNRQGAPLTRYGVRYILTRYVHLASDECPSLQGKRVHPHVMRHTTALHLLQSGVDLNTIRCWLGHVDVATTNRYVEADFARPAARASRSPSDSAQQVAAGLARSPLTMWSNGAGSQGRARESGAYST